MGDSNISDKESMDILTNYPAVYNRSSIDFCYKNKKGNSWRAIAESARLDVSQGNCSKCLLCKCSVVETNAWVLPSVCRVKYCRKR